MNPTTLILSSQYVNFDKESKFGKKNSFGGGGGGECECGREWCQQRR